MMTRTTYCTALPHEEVRAAWVRDVSGVQHRNILKYMIRHAQHDGTSTTAARCSWKVNVSTRQPFSCLGRYTWVPKSPKLSYLNAEAKFHVRWSKPPKQSCRQVRYGAHSSRDDRTLVALGATYKFHS